MKTHLGLRLKKARLDMEAKTGRRITQYDLADATGLHRTHISMIERKVRDSMPPEAAAKAAQYLECDFWWLLTGSSDAPSAISAASKSGAVNRVPVPDPDQIDQYIEIAAEIRAISDQLINNAQNNLPVTRLVKSLVTVCNEFASMVPTKPAQ